MPTLPAELVELDRASQRAISGGGGGELIKLAADIIREVVRDFLENYQCFARGFREALRG